MDIRYCLILLLFIVGCSYPPLPAPPVAPPVIEVEPVEPLVKEVIPEKVDKPIEPVNPYECDKIELEPGNYYGIIEGIRVEFRVRRWGNNDPLECGMYFDSISTWGSNFIGDDDCNRFANEFHMRGNMYWNRKPPYVMDWKKIDRVLRLGYLLVCKKNLNGSEQFWRDEAARIFESFGVEE